MFSSVRYLPVPARSYDARHRAYDARHRASKTFVPIRVGTDPDLSIPAYSDGVMAHLAALKAQGDPDAEYCFTVHGTMSDVRWLDPAQDPSDRTPGTCYLGDPRIANDGPVGLGRFTTLRSWLSQWSYDESRADGLGNASRIACPVLVITNTADLACTPSHAARLFAAVGSADKCCVEIAGADHYYTERPDLLPQAVSAVSDWLTARGFAG